MIWKQNADKHDIHDRGVVGDKNIRYILIFFLSGEFNKIISETHSVEHSETPDSDQLIAVFIMFFIKR